MTTKSQSIPRRGEVWLVDFDPTRGAEINKTRPALIVQNDIANKYSSISIVAAITAYAGDTLYPTEVLVGSKEGGLDKESVVVLSQLRSVDKQRLIKKLGVVKSTTLRKVDLALKISLDLLGGFA